MDGISKLVVAVPLCVGLAGCMALQVNGVLDLFDIGALLCGVGLFQLAIFDVKITL